MKTNRRIRVASLLAVAALGLSACGTVEDLTGGGDDTSTQEEQDSNEGDDGSEGEGEETTEEETDGGDEEATEEETDGGDEEATEAETDGGEEEPSEEPTDGTGATTDEGTTDGGADGGSTSLTPPGTQLKVGDSATIPQGDEGGTVEVTVSKITKGSFSDLAHLKDADEYKAYTPVYVEYTITGTEDSSVLEYSILDDVHPITQDGNKAGSLVIFSGSGQSFDKCDPNSFPKDFGPGQTVTDCDIAMLADGQEIGGAMFQQFEGQYADENKVVWEQ